MPSSPNSKEHAAWRERQLFLNRIAELEVERDRLIDRLLQATPHCHGSQTVPGLPVFDCARCKLDKEFAVRTYT